MDTTNRGLFISFIQLIFSPCRSCGVWRRVQVCHAGSKLCVPGHFDTNHPIDSFLQRTVSFCVPPYLPVLFLCLLIIFIIIALSYWTKVEWSEFIHLEPRPKIPSSNAREAFKLSAGRLSSIQEAYSTFVSVKITDGFRYFLIVGYSSQLICATRVFLSFVGINKTGTREGQKAFCSVKDNMETRLSNIT